MPLDGIFCNNLCRELRKACGSRIDKIFQPSKDELVFLLRSAGFAERLLVSAKPGTARLHFTNETLENPATPPMFCMLLRKHLSGAKLLDVTQDGYERIISLHFSATDEMGYRRIVKLTAELIGNQSNIILVNEDGRIIDAVRRSDIELSARLIQPGAVYEPPTSLGKGDLNAEDIEERILNNKNQGFSDAVLNTISGVSPLVAREIAFIADPFDAGIESINDTDRLNSALSKLREYAQNGKPYMLISKDGTPRDFSFMPINQYGNEFSLMECGSFCELLDRFYSQHDRMDRLKQSSAEISKVLQNLIARTERKLYLREEELKKCADREKFRIYGELIKANISLIERGATFADVPNYYDENLNNIRIPLKPELSPAENSARYFKEYRKKCTAETTLHGLIESCKSEKEYLCSVFDALTRAESSAEISEIKEELTASGYIRRQTRRGVKQKPLKFKEFEISGYKILVGRNNLQNDTLTLRTAQKSDIWLHTKDIHGSHTVIICDGTTPPDEVILAAAQIAAFNSQAKNSSKVPVDYTLIKYVKKPAGAKPGMVIYTHQKTILVEPNAHTR